MILCCIEPNHAWKNISRLFFNSIHSVAACAAPGALCRGELSDGCRFSQSLSIRLEVRKTSFRLPLTSLSPPTPMVRTGSGIGVLHRSAPSAASSALKVPLVVDPLNASRFVWRYAKPPSECLLPLCHSRTIHARRDQRTSSLSHGPVRVVRSTGLMVRRDHLVRARHSAFDVQLPRPRLHHLRLHHPDIRLAARRQPKPHGRLQHVGVAHSGPVGPRRHRRLDGAQVRCARYGSSPRRHRDVRSRATRETPTDGVSHGIYIASRGHACFTSRAALL